MKPMSDTLSIPGNNPMSDTDNNLMSKSDNKPMLDTGNPVTVLLDASVSLRLNSRTQPTIEPYS